MFKKEYTLLRIVIVSVFVNMILYHYPFISYIMEHLELSKVSAYITFACVIIALFGVQVLLFHLIALFGVRFFKLFLMITFMANSIALYFVQTYNVILDRAMMGNAFNTRYSEASAYFDPKIFIYIIFLGILPSIIIYKIKIKPSKKIGIFLSGFGMFILSVFILYMNSFTWLWLDKNAKFLGGLAMPWSYSINAIRVELKKSRANEKQLLLPNGKFKNNKKTVVVLVIGESARASQFSLYGYSKDTNPQLEKEDVLVLKNTYSTGTYTTKSVASILSYDGSPSNGYEPLTNYLHRMGAYVEWRANNWGAPKEKIDHFYKAGELKKLCKGEGCNYDEVLITNLNKSILSVKKSKILMVLHTAGSHGPTYFKKYPPSFEHFKPVCKTVDLKECSKKSLFNAYDNTILYTDYFLAKTIDKLKKLHLPVLFLYLSDHGESLGEYNLYLHGTPYAIAPDFQKKIPFIVWESKEFLKLKGFKKPYIRAKKRYGQNDIFSTILDALGFESSIYIKENDLLYK